MGWLIAAIILLAVGIFPLGVQGRYNSGNAELFVVLGSVRLPVGKTKKKVKKTKKSNASFSSHATGKKAKSSGNITRFLPLIRPVLQFLADFRKKLRVDDLQLKVVFAGGDPCDMSINYGRTWIAIGNLMPYLERFFVIKKRNIEIECDYAGEKTSVFFSISLTITIFRLLQIVLYHGISLLCEYVKILKKAKDGVVV